MNLTYYSVSETCIMHCSAHCDTGQMLAFWIFSALTQEPMEMVMVHQTEAIGTAGSIHKGFPGPEVQMKALSMHALSSSSPSAAAKYLIDKKSESSMSAMMSESMVSTTSTSQMKKISVFSHAEASSSLETISSELKMGEKPSCESNILLHPQ